MRLAVALALLLAQPQFDDLKRQWEDTERELRAIPVKPAPVNPPVRGDTDGVEGTKPAGGPDYTWPAGAGGAAAVTTAIAVAWAWRRKRTINADGSSTTEEGATMKIHINQRTGQPFPRGARPTPRHLLAAAEPFRPITAAPPYFFIFPKNIDQNGTMTCWGNANYGNCVTAEEAFNKACGGVFISDATVIAWCQANGTLNGANLQPVIQQMQAKGFSQDGNIYGDGTGLAVNYADQPTLNAAIYQAGQQTPRGCVKFGLAADELPGGAGNQNGWTLAEDSPDSNEDHCMGACGYGTIGQFFAAINAAFGTSLPVPTKDGNGNAIDPAAIGVAVYTWSTIGWCTFTAFVNMTGEAWIRNPNSVNTGSGTPAPDSVYVTGAPAPTPAPPLPPPVPPGPPDPAPVPVPVTFVPPYYIFEGQTLMGLATGYPDAVTAGTAAQALANQDQVQVSIRDSQGNLVGTAIPVTPTPPTPPGPSPGTQITVPTAGVYQLISPATQAALAKTGLTVDQYVAAGEAFQAALGGSGLRVFRD